LAEQAKPTPTQDLGAQFVVIQVQAKGGAPLRSDQKPVGRQNVDFSLQQGKKHLRQLGPGLQLHHHHGRFGVGHRLLVKNRPGRVRVIHHHPDNGAVRRVQNGQRHHMHMPALQNPDQLQQPSGLVGQKNGKLPDRVSLFFSGGHGSRHKKTLAPSPYPRQPRIVFAVFRPLAPKTPPPGWVLAPVRKRFFIGAR